MTLPRELTRYYVHPAGERWVIYARRTPLDVRIGWRTTERAARAFVADLEQRTAKLYQPMRDLAG